MKKLLSLFLLSMLCLNSASIAYAVENIQKNETNTQNIVKSKYIEYTVKNEDFPTKRIAKNYKKRIWTVKNISNTPLKIVWYKDKNGISPAQAIHSCCYYITPGAAAVSFIGGMTIIGAPFGIYKGTEMTKNKNAKLLTEINSFVNNNSIKEGLIIQPNESFEVYLIEYQDKNQPKPSMFIHFTNNLEADYQKAKVVEDIELK